MLNFDAPRGTILRKTPKYSRRRKLHQGCENGGIETKTQCKVYTWAVAFGLLLSAGAINIESSSAQTTSTSTEGNPTSLREVYSDWTVSCRAKKTRVAGQLSNCQMSQELRDDKSGQLVLAFALPAIPIRDGVNAVMVAPFGLMLSKGIGLSVVQSAGQPEIASAQAPFHTCLPAGCIARFKLNSAMIDAMRRSAEAQVKLASADKEQIVQVKISLNGFTAAERRLKALAAKFE